MCYGSFMTKTQAAQTVIMVAAVLFGLMAFSSTANTALIGDTFKPCSSVEQAEGIVAQRFRELGETEVTWSVKELPKGVAGLAAGTDIALSSSHACNYLRSTVDHEWAHVQQNRMYPKRADKAFGGHGAVEILADCVAQVFGNPDYSPYLRERGYGCTQEEYATAQRIIDFGRNNG